MWHVWGKEKCIQGFGGGDLRERGHLEVLVVDGSVVLEGIFNKWDGGMYWIDLAQDKDRCSNELLGSIKCGEFLD